MTTADAASEVCRPRPVPAAPRPRDETVAFDDLLLERWSRSPCVLCHTPRPGYYVLWMDHETGFVMLCPLCQPCQRRPDRALQLADAMHRQLHPEEPQWMP